MNKLIRARANQNEGSITRRYAAFGAVFASLLLGVAACSSSGASTAGNGPDTVARAHAASVTTEMTGVTEWVAYRDASAQSVVIEGRDVAGEVVTVVESRGGPHTVSMSVDADVLEMNDQAGVLTDTLSAHSQQIITRVKADLEGTEAADAIRASGNVEHESSEIGVTRQAATSVKPKTSTANCVACWIMTLGSLPEFCYTMGHCDN